MPRAASAAARSGSALPAPVHSVRVAGAAAAFNQIAERDLDESMERTRLRPLPSGRVHPAEARRFALVLAIIGILQLAAFTNLIAAGVALATLLSYVVVYTPLKRRTHWATLVGAVPGALPPVIGWTAAHGALSVEGEIRGSCWIGERARIEAGARVGPGAVIGHDAVLRPGCEIEASLALPGARPPADKLRRAVAFADEVWRDA